MNARLGLVPALALSVIVTACTGAGGGGTPAPSPDPSSSPPPTAEPTPTLEPAPIVASPEEAAARVIASDPKFTGIGRKDPDLIGQGSWWEAEKAGDAYRVHVQVGWGDCPAGCINRHDWIFSVTPDGTITLVEESGDPLPGITY